ncbi:MAG: HAD-IA family hydrolase [Acidimicrobiia bacterium]|nr:HAD-IA family hydrolase [Acidimicrobiia bacterium]MYD04032.1 HAD-IA family hydrolase [Acidimicrobiia bacterium]
MRDDIRAVVWDMGGILYETPFEALGQVEEQHGWAKGVLPRGPFSKEGDAEYRKCSTGELSESRYWADYQEASRARGYPINLKTEIDWTDRVRPEVMTTIETLGKRYSQATLSNDSSEWLGVGWWESWPYAHLFEQVIDVVTLGFRKPDPRTYLTVAERLALEPSQCLFVDDMEVNIKGGEAVGMPGLFFDHTRVRESCDRLLDLLL